jgi:RNA polymerase sigma-70 factor (ECF subfamily)
MRLNDAGAPSDEALLARAAEGDAPSFEMLVARHGDALYRFATRICRHAGDADDALQDGLLAAWRGASTYRGDASARTWLFQVVVHACRRRCRRRAGEPAAHDGIDEAAALAGKESPADDRAGARQVAVAMERALASMSDDAREVLLLRDVEGLSGDDTAAALGIALAAMKSRLHRARLDLKARVEEILGHPVEEMLS